MAELCYKDASVTINAVDLSDHVRACTINYSAEILDKTAMGDDSRNRLAGLKDWSLDVEWNQDFAAGEVDATLFPLVGAAEFAVIIKPTSDAVSATNPSFTGNAVMESYPPLAGAVGSLATVTSRILGSGDLARNTS